MTVPRAADALCRARSALRLLLFLLCASAAAAREPCLEGAAFHSLAASVNASGQWSASLFLEKDSRIFRQADQLRLDVRPAASLCAGVRTVAMTVELHGPPPSALVDSPSIPDAEVTLGAPLRPQDDLGYTEVPGVGFYKVHPKKMNWKDAKTVCESESAHLVIINSDDEATALKNLLGPLNQWITRTLHAGFFATSTDYFTLLGQPLNNMEYKLWAEGEPKPVDICGSIDHFARLNDAYCSWNVQRSFVCEFGSAPPTAGGAATPLPPPKPPAITASGAHVNSANYERISGVGSYKVHRESASWPEAQGICAAEGAHLAVLETKAEAAAVTAYVNALDRLPVLAHGLHVGVFAQSHFLTIFGDPLTATGYSGWAQGEPNNQPCVVAHEDFSYASVSCASRTQFVCEKMDTI